MTVFHPWASLRTPAEQAEVEATMDYMLEQDGAAFLTLSETALWWNARDQCVVRFAECPDGWLVCAHNPLDQDVKGLTIVIKGGAECVSAAHHEVEEMPLKQRDGDALIRIDLAARSEFTGRVTWKRT